MLERCTAMSGLTKKEIADFVEANAKRRPGEWCFTVVDERIRAKKEEQEAIQVCCLWSVVWEASCQKLIKL